MKLSHISAGLTAVVVGYSSSVVLVIQAAQASGANPAQITSWLLVLGLTMGFTSIALSLVYRIPVLTAWSTPGASFLIAAANGLTIEQSTGAFIVAGGLIMLSGFVKPLAKAIESIPPALGAAMLAGILLPIGLGAFTPLPEFPLLCIAFYAVYILGRMFFSTYLMLVLLVFGGLSATLMGDMSSALSVQFSSVEFVRPEFNLSAITTVAIPLFIISMLSQNLPGLAIMQGHGYKAPTQPVLKSTGLVNVLSAPFGGFTCNLAAITAAICMSEQVDKDPEQRYKAAVAGGIVYLLAGIFASVVVAIFTAMPLVITQLLAGLALLATIQASLEKSFAVDKHKEAALMTLLVTASGISFAGLSAPVLGLLFGLVFLLAKRWTKH